MKLFFFVLKMEVYIFAYYVCLLVCVCACVCVCVSVYRLNQSKSTRPILIKFGGKLSRAKEELIRFLVKIGITTTLNPLYFAVH